MVTEHEPMKKVDNLDYLYEITYTNMDWDEAIEWFFRSNRPKQDLTAALAKRGFGCSTAREGNFYGRNFDFPFSKAVDIVVHTTCSGCLTPRYYSVGVASCNQLWTSDYIEHQSFTELDYAILPFALIDGINEKGVVCNCNVVPAKDLAGTTQVITPERNDNTREVYYQFLVRYILDNAYSAKHAISLLETSVIITSNIRTEPGEKGFHVDYDGIEPGGCELHYMIADKDDTYIVEFVNNKLVVHEFNGADKDKIMTNYYLSMPYTRHAAGVERYNILREKLARSTINKAEDMVDLMKQVKFSNCYRYPSISGEGGFEKIWFSDMIGDIIHFLDAEQYFEDNPDQKDALRKYMKKEADIIDSRDRTHTGDECPWITIHTSIFDIEKKCMTIYTQENYEKSCTFYT